MPPSDRALAALLGTLVLAGYSAIAWAVGSFYPFSVFPMYAGSSHDTRAARVAARTADGTIVEVTAFQAFACDGPVDPDAFSAQCGGHAYSPRYLDDELSYHVRAGAAEVAHGEPIEIVRRIWTLAPDGSVSASDCVLTRCRAAR